MAFLITQIFRPQGDFFLVMCLSSTNRAYLKAGLR
jgi:hypothetical protein